MQAEARVAQLRLQCTRTHDELVHTKARAKEHEERIISLREREVALVEEVKNKDIEVKRLEARLLESQQELVEVKQV